MVKFKYLYILLYAYILFIHFIIIRIILLYIIYTQTYDKYLDCRLYIKVFFGNQKTMLDRKSHQAILKTLELEPEDYTHIASYGEWEVWLTIDGEMLSTRIESTTTKSIFYVLQCDARYTWTCSPEEIDKTENYIAYSTGFKRVSKF